MKAWLELPGVRQLFAQEYWNIGLTVRSAAQILAEGRLGAVDWWRNPGLDRFRADPVGCWDADRRGLRIYFEELLLWSARGVIRSVGYDGMCCRDDFRDELALDVHLSYPSIAVVAGEPRMMPEMHEAHGPVSFGLKDGRWTPRRAYLPNVHVLDPTPFEHDGTWFLFHTVAGHTANTVLHLQWAADPDGPWQPHPASPMQIGLAGARPAGAPFRVGSRIYRPAQDSSGGYGAGLIIHEVLRLDRFGFEERRAAALAPEPDTPYPDGLHSFMPCGDRVFVDGKLRAFIAWASLYKLINLCRTFTRAVVQR
jgi:hypothetical protein